MTVLVLGVPEEAIVIDLHLSLLVAVLQTELHVLAERLAFLLGKARHDCDQHFALGIHRVDGLLFEVDRDVLVLELADVLEAVEGVAGKTGDRFSDDHVDVPGHALVDHAVEFVALLCVGAGDAVVRKNASQHPFWILLDVLGVVSDLRIVAGFLLVGIRADAAVGCDGELWLFAFFDRVPDLRSGGNEHYVCRVPLWPHRK